MKLNVRKNRTPMGHHAEVYQSTTYVDPYASTVGGTNQPTPNTN